MERRELTFRGFFSSTFSDLKAESIRRFGRLTSGFAQDRQDALQREVSL